MEHRGRAMVGILSMPECAPRQAWLFLNPFGQEAIRAQPTYRSLADRLARAGIAVLRFDFHGSGDSEGELAEQSLDDWVGDSVHAAKALLSSARTTRVRLFGIGLGGTLCLMAAMSAPVAVDSILAWEPVINGPAYLESLKSTHRREVANAFDLSWPEVRSRFGEADPTVPGSVLGFEMGAAMAEQIDALISPPLDALAARGVRTTLALSRKATDPGRASNFSTRLLDIESPIDWMTNEALGTALVPVQLITLFDEMTQAA